MLLLGAEVFRRYVGPEPALAMARTLRLGALLGALLLVTVSVADVTWTVTQLLGRFDPAFILEYLWSTNHGHATLLRLGLTVAVLVLSLKPASSTGWLAAPPGLGILGTFSFLSHAAAMHGRPALVVDLLHFTAATLWGGAVLYTALSPMFSTVWRNEPADPALTKVMGRVSSVGLVSVLTLAATGIYASVLHLTRPAELTTTPYGLALILKLALVGITLAVAGFNRWWLLPALKRGKVRRLGQMLRLEALLLIAVFAATGILTTRPLPHG